MQYNTENPFVSIIVPICNTERYLRQCINSLLYQTLKNIEIILVDDGSTDNCPAICDNYAEEDNRIRVIHQQNSGYGKSCNVGLDAAKGEYIGIIEADDFTELNMFECLYNLAKTHELDIVRCHYYSYHARTNACKKNNLPHVPQNIIFSPIKKPDAFFQVPSIWAHIYKRSFLKNFTINFLETPGASYQDTSFVFKAYACAKKFMLIENAFVYYRNHDNSSINSKNKIFCICTESSEIERFSKEKGLYDELKFVIARVKFSRYMWNYHRLTNENAYSFLKIFSAEFRRHLENGEILENLFSQREIKKIHTIAFLYPLFHFRRLIFKCARGKSI